MLALGMLLLHLHEVNALLVVRKVNQGELEILHAGRQAGRKGGKGGASARSLRPLQHSQAGWLRNPG